MVQSVDVEITAVRITTMSGSVSVVAEPGLDVVSADRVPLRVDGPTITVDSKSERVVVRVPEGMDLVIGTTSGKVKVVGRVGAAAVATTAGEVSIEHAASVDVRSASGQVEIDHCDGDCRVVSGSGRVTVGRCGPADIAATSGRIVLDSVSGPVLAHCTSGRIEITMAIAADVDAETVSGRVSISLPTGARARMDSPSAGVVAVGGEHDCVVIARSGSGRVSVTTR